MWWTGKNDYKMMPKYFRKYFPENNYLEVLNFED